MTIDLWSIVISRSKEIGQFKFVKLIISCRSMKHRKYCYTNFIKRIYIAICARDTYYAKVKKIYEIINLMRGCIMTRVLFLDIDGVLNSNFWNDSH